MGSLDSISLGHRLDFTREPTFSEKYIYSTVNVLLGDVMKLSIQQDTITSYAQSAEFGNEDKYVKLYADLADVMDLVRVNHMADIQYKYCIAAMIQYPLLSLDQDIIDKTYIEALEMRRPANRLNITKDLYLVMEPLSFPKMSLGPALRCKLAPWAMALCTKIARIFQYSLSGLQRVLIILSIHQCFPDYDDDLKISRLIYLAWKIESRLHPFQKE